jgi:hypothetical protein
VENTAVKAPVAPHRAPAPSCLKMFHQIWAALLYFYGILLNSIYQCPEHSQLTTLGVDDKEVRTEEWGKLTVEAEGLKWVARMIKNNLGKGKGKRVSILMRKQ